MKYLWFIILVINIFGQVGFDSNGWNSDQKIGKSFNIGRFYFLSNQNFYTNYGYNFDVNSNSLYYVFQTDSDYINITSNSYFTAQSISAYQVSEKSIDTLIIEGWKDKVKLYWYEFDKLYKWTILPLNFVGINKLTIKNRHWGKDKFLIDYNFDNFILDSAKVQLKFN